MLQWDGPRGHDEALEGRGQSQGRLAAIRSAQRTTKRRKVPLVAECSFRNPTLDLIERAYILWVFQAKGGKKARTVPAPRGHRTRRSDPTVTTSPPTYRAPSSPAPASFLQNPTCGPREGSRSGLQRST